MTKEDMASWRTRQGVTMWPGVVLAVMLAGIAFVSSFDALRVVFQASGMTPAITWMGPICVDGIVMLCTWATWGFKKDGMNTLYPWAGIILFSGMSVIGNALHARPLTVNGVTLPDWAPPIIMSIPPVAYLYAMHLLVIIASRRLAAIPAPTPKPADEPAVDDGGETGEDDPIDGLEAFQDESPRTAPAPAPEPPRPLPSLIRFDDEPAPIRPAGNDAAPDPAMDDAPFDLFAHTADGGDAHETMPAAAAAARAATPTLRVTLPDPAPRPMAEPTAAPDAPTPDVEPDTDPVPAATAPTATTAGGKGDETGEDDLAAWATGLHAEGVRITASQLLISHKAGNLSQARSMLKTLRDKHPEVFRQ